MSRFSDERSAIEAALTAASISNIMRNKEEIPKSLPCAIVTLNEERGIRGTVKQYTDTEVDWTVYIVVNAQNVDDPDKTLHELKEKFREKYILGMGRDLPVVQFYSGRVDGARLVRIAKIELLKSGSRAGS